VAGSDQVPGYGTARRAGGRNNAGASGTPGRDDPTTEPGQYPPGEAHGIFGVPLPAGTGAPGSVPSRAAASESDSTNLPGQLGEVFTGVPVADAEGYSPSLKIGTRGAEPSTGTGPDSVVFTRPGSHLSGSYGSDTVRDEVDGPGNWTEANDSGYATGGPQLPGIKGNEPQAGGTRFQPGAGRVLHGNSGYRGA
jgi:hypothetical protein